MYELRFRTRTYGAQSEITLRNSIDGWDHDLEATYADDDWVVRLQDDGAHPRRYADGMEFKFLLGRRNWMLGPNLEFDPGTGPPYVWGESAVQFGTPYGDIDLIVENGSIARKFFAPDLDERRHDVVIVGSGAGGAVLADQLSDVGLDVLVLEAGSYLFPTHVANLPREQSIGVFDKHVWRLWYHFGVQNADNEPGTDYVGRQGFNLGGRTLYWGGLAPRMAPWELGAWPQEIVADLRSGGYDRAESIIGAGAVPDSPYQKATRSVLRQLLPEYTHTDARMAIQYRGVTATSLPFGLFSTADLLMESRLTPGPQGNEHLKINLNHVATRVFSEDQGAAVEAYDLIAETPRTFRGRVVVLACGTVETPKLALASTIDVGGQVGTGITDHPIYYVHFGIPATSPHARAGDSSKTISRHKHADRDHHPYMMVLELGADFNQGRYIDVDILDAHEAAKGGGFTLCELVFLFHSPLVLENAVTYTGDPAKRVALQMKPSPAAADHKLEIGGIARRVIEAHDGMALANETLDLKLGELGAVAHEVGTMRIRDVVDTDLKIIGHDNLYVCDNSVFPASPAANPTLTLVALADRLARHLQSRLTP